MIYVGVSFKNKAIERSKDMKCRVCVDRDTEKEIMECRTRLEDDDVLLLSETESQKNCGVQGGERSSPAAENISTEYSGI